MVRTWIAGLGLALLMAPGSMAEPLTARFADVVTPDPDLLAFLTDIVRSAQDGIGRQSRAYAVIDEATAPMLKGFNRGLDPLAPWHALDLSDEAASGIDLLSRHMVETGEVIGDAIDLPDDRQTFLELLVALVGNPDEPLGRMPEMGDAVCSPARLAFDKKATVRFAKEMDRDAYSLFFYPHPVELHSAASAGASVTATLPTRTLLVNDHAVDGPEGWSLVVASDGTRGWLQDGGDYEGLSQQHLCFGKVNGQYRIVGFFSYGL